MTFAARASSLRWRLPALILALLASIGGAFAWTAHREMRHALRLAADDRVHNAAYQLADLLAQSVAARVAETRRLAADAAVRRFVVTGDNPDAALLVLRAAGQRSPQAKISLRARGAGTATRLASDNVVLERAPGPVDSAETVPADGAGPLQLAGGQVFYRTTATIARSPGDTGDGKGFLSIERLLTSSPASGVGLIERLIGSGAVLRLGNATGDVWTDLTKPVAGPPAVPPGATTVSFVDEGKARHLGTAVPITGTSWHVWVQFTEAPLMQPAATLLRRMLPWTVALILLGGLAVRIVSARITTPLQQMADAADAIAAGDYSRRIGATGSSEIGRLGTAFNVMATRVGESHEALETRVRTRTEELGHTREEMDQFFSMSLDLLLMADLEGHFTRVNPAWEQALGWTAADLTAGPYLDLVHPDDREATARESAKLAEGKRTACFENRYRCKDGSYRWLSWKAVANIDRRLIYAVARDVTDERRAALELQRKASELTVSNRELEAFSYSVSHDLRAPLRGVDGFSQALLEDCGDRLGPEGRDYLHRIRGAAQHMGRLIDDLLKLARVTRADLHWEPVDLTAMAQTTLAELSHADRARVVEWSVQPGLRATGDSRLLQIAVTNLLENAWKFTGKRDRARIEFGMRQNGGATREYFVKDNGAGFDSTYGSKLFGAFQRLHHARDFPGTGIGLATVQRIVRRHGGDIRAEGAPELGATFSFTLNSEAHV
jgi:PAS domain S-box-containing protein